MGWDVGRVTCDHVRDAIHHDGLLNDVLRLTASGSAHHHRLASGLLEDDGMESRRGRCSQNSAALNLGGNDSASGL